VLLGQGVRATEPRWDGPELGRVRAGNAPEVLREIVIIGNNYENIGSYRSGQLDNLPEVEAPFI
jgi:hypothetical protein